MKEKHKYLARIWKKGSLCRYKETVIHNSEKSLSPITSAWMFKVIICSANEDMVKLTHSVRLVKVNSDTTF